MDAQGHRIIPWELQQGKPVHLEGMPLLSVRYPGQALDYTETAAASVVSHRFVSMCERLGIQDEVQFIPARAGGYSEPFFVLNALRIIRCIDEDRCKEVAFWEPRHGEPELVGAYRDVRGLRIDPTKVGDANIFRPWGWPVALIVSERVKVAIEGEGITGTTFIEV
ncbi:hypothetical protein DAT35_51965 [Vitiosangium sp. GDMCC 1.1324]|nr:hypothetical protein DAT35_51965 [Vitiosangium sp. GDMCC 1.1324]